MLHCSAVRRMPADFEGLMRTYEYFIKRKGMNDPDGRLVVLFEVVDSIDDAERCSGECPLFDTRQEAQAWTNRQS